MACAYNMRSTRCQPFNGGKRSANTEVVCDDPIFIGAFHWNIEVSTNKNSLARHIAKILKRWYTRHVEGLLFCDVKSEINQSV